MGGVLYVSGSFLGFKYFGLCVRIWVVVGRSWLSWRVVRRSCCGRIWCLRSFVWCWVRSGVFVVVLVVWGV